MNKPGDLIPVKETEQKAIVAGMITEGFGRYLSEAVVMRERVGPFQSRVFRFILSFSKEQALDDDLATNVDLFAMLGREFAREFQDKLMHNVRPGRYGDKVVMDIQQYEELVLRGKQ